jgi:hypothetical protein
MSAGRRAEGLKVKWEKQAEENALEEEQEGLK